MRKLFPLLPTMVALLGCLPLAGCGGGTTGPTCGNGEVEAGEDCDDGNTTSGDGCSSTCKSESAGVCGNMKVETGEQCDDGNTTSGDGCSATCQSEPGGPRCGDGKTDTGETCDDGNTTSGDGCSSTCQKEIPATCGDGKTDLGEQCDDGNKTAGDGCENDCTKTPSATEVVCQTLSPLPSGTCAVTEGDAGRVIVGTVLTPTKLYRGGQVVLDAQGNIAFVGCKADCDADASCKAASASATAITCPTGVVSPGLINTHDHITYAQNAPYTNTGERYEHRHQWRSGQCGHKKIPAPGGASGDQISWGELRFLFGGATSTVGSGGQTGLLRNLDRANMEEGLGQPAVNFDTFPLNDSSSPSTCNAPPACSSYSGVVAPSSLNGDDAYLPHVAEGINAFAENEFVCLSSANPGHDVVIDKSAFIHGVGLTPQDYAQMGKNGTGLIWSPRSNITLYGDTAIVTEAARFGVTIALGTDWMPSGSMNLLRELRCADSLNQGYYNKYFTDHDLWMMVTSNAAALTAVDDVVGTLAAGKIGDIAIFDGSKKLDYRAIIDAEPKDVVLVLRAGKPLYGDAGVISAIPNAGSCDAVDVCTNPKQVCLQGEIGKTYAALKTSVGASIYKDFFCGDPDNEPSCKPTRPAAVNNSTIYTGDITADDSDGDGIPNAMDNCPAVFNPVRPMDNGVQADGDGDGVGDACDPCPLDANTTQCTTFDPNDSDGDGVPNATDNCPTKANTDQADGDGDGKGDVCDPCPTVKNPGSAACPATIYQIKDGTVPVGNTVALTNQLVTGRAKAGYFLQIKPGDPDYDATKGANNSGVYVFDSANTVKVGDRVTLSSATVSNYFGQIQLTMSTATVVTSNNEASPAPVVVTPAEVATGGAKAAALESVIVQVDNVKVTDIAPPVGGGDSTPNNEFVVGGSLRVNDFLYLITPFPTLNQNYGSLVGILDYRNNDSKLELRGASDVIGGTPVLTAFGPALSYATVGQTGMPTFPTALTVQLSNAPTSDTFVTVTSADPNALAIVGGGSTVLAGQTSATVLVDGVAQAASVALTATLDAASLTANVRVLDAAETPVISSLTPPTPSVSPGGTLTLTVTLDFPAPAGGTTVDLALAPSSAGAIPATVTVPANQLSATFDYVDASMETSATVTATLGTSTASSTITIVAGGTCNATSVLISEIRSRGAAGAGDEFVELYNPTNAAITLDNTWKLEARSNTNTSYSSRWVGTGKVIPAHGHFLIAFTGYTQTPAADEKLSTGITDATSLRLMHGSTKADAVCYAFDATTSMPFTSDATYTCEGTPVTNPHNNTTGSNTDASIERKPGGTAGNCGDTGDNAADFTILMPANPQSSQSAPTP
ncbi:Metal dependent amidohydrolase [Minicystis rosea]|nr:Metal dependent amidohydrolase [Minicystis rosea]